MKVIIIGGGIGGLSAAIALGRAGVEAAVYEQAERLREVGAGLTLWANASRAWGKLGAAGGAAQDSGPRADVVRGAFEAYRPEAREPAGVWFRGGGDEVRAEEVAEKARGDDAGGSCRAHRSTSAVIYCSARTPSNSSSSCWRNQAKAGRRLQ